jgi:hypothetical protein
MTNTEIHITGLTAIHAIQIVNNHTTSAKQNDASHVPTHIISAKNGRTFANVTNILNIIENHAHKRNNHTNLINQVIVLLSEWAFANISSASILPSCRRYIFFQFEALYDHNWSDVCFQTTLTVPGFTVKNLILISHTFGSSGFSHI